VGVWVKKSPNIYLTSNKKHKHMNKKDLKSGYSIYGNKGNVWSNTSHIYKSGTGNLCGTPALSNNWAVIEGVEHIGCPNCLTKYKDTESN
jgi:hypothetical protein